MDRYQRLKLCCSSCFSWVVVVVGKYFITWILFRMFLKPVDEIKRLLKAVCTAVKSFFYGKKKWCFSGTLENWINSLSFLDFQFAVFRIDLYLRFTVPEVWDLSWVAPALLLTNNIYYSVFALFSPENQFLFPCSGHVAISGWLCSGREVRWSLGQVASNGNIWWCRVNAG